MDEAQKGKLRVKSVHPPLSKTTVVGDLLIFGGVQVAAALFLQTGASVEAWEQWVAYFDGNAPLAYVILVGVMPNVLIYYPYSLFYMVLDLCLYDHPWVVSKKIQPVRCVAFSAQTAKLHSLHSPHPARPSARTLMLFY